MPELPPQFLSMDLGNIEDTLAKLQALKEYQLKNQELRKENQELKTQAAYVSASSKVKQAPQSQVDSISQARDSEALTAEEKKEITLVGKKLVVVSHIWFDTFDFYNLNFQTVATALAGHHHYASPDQPLQDEQDDAEILRLHIALDVYQALRPQYHSFIERKYEPFASALKDGATACRSALVNRLKTLRPTIFKDVLAPETFEPSYDHSQCAACRALRGLNAKGGEIFPPVLFPPGDEKDLRMLFRSPVLVRIAIAILYGPQRLHASIPANSKNTTTKKTNGDLWAIKETCGGLIAFAGVAAYFLLGSDADQFSPKSRENARSFLDDCTRYKLLIIASLEGDQDGLSAMQETIQFFNEHVFHLRSQPKPAPTVPSPVSKEEVMLRRNMLTALKGKAVSRTDSDPSWPLTPDSHTWEMLSSDLPGDSVTTLIGNLDTLQLNQSEPSGSEFLYAPYKPPVDAEIAPAADGSRDMHSHIDSGTNQDSDLSDLTETDDDAPVSAVMLARQHSELLGGGDEAVTDSDEPLNYNEASGLISEKPPVSKQKSNEPVENVVIPPATDHAAQKLNAQPAPSRQGPRQVKKAVLEAAPDTAQESNTQPAPSRQGPRQVKKAVSKAAPDTAQESSTQPAPSRPRPRPRPRQFKKAVLESAPDVSTPEEPNSLLQSLPVDDITPADRPPRRSSRRN